MGYIYKITNSINNKVYIGKTSRSLNLRWIEHKKESIFSDRPLYKAMRKYGLDAFNISLIEETTEEQLNEREKYWIAYYNSYGHNGYNCTMGGDGQTKYDYSAVLQLYEQGHNCREIAYIIGCSYDAVLDTLKSHNIKIMSSGEVTKQKTKKPVKQLDKEGHLIATYDSIQDAAKALGKNNSGSASHIADACKGTRKTAFGYKWEFITK